MEMLLYLVLGAVVYGVLADHTDRAVEREVEKRRDAASDLELRRFVGAADRSRPARRELSRTRDSRGPGAQHHG